jgi:hypothetical protein
VKCACAIFSSVTSPTVQYFSTLSHKRHDFRKKKVSDRKMCVLSFCTTFARNISHSTNNLAHCDKMYIGLHVKYPLFLLDFNETLNFLDRFFEKILKYQIS